MKANQKDIKTEEEKEVQAVREERWEGEDEGRVREREDSSPQCYQTLQQSRRLTLRENRCVGRLLVLQRAP